MADTQMFCFQCEQTAQGRGCTQRGVCGKDAHVASLQDLLVYALKGLSQVAVEARRIGISDPRVNRLTVEAAFATLTNVNFDPLRIASLIREAVSCREKLKEKVRDRGGETSHHDGPANISLKDTIEGLAEQGRKVGIMEEVGAGSDAHSLRWTLIYGIKGISAYADHAAILGREDEAVYAFVSEGLAAASDMKLGVPDLLGLVLRAGQMNLRAMELLDEANTRAYGSPVPTKVPLGHRKRKAILVSGHDLRDLDLILRQSEGKGIDVYTHGEMLPAHGYPELKKFSHLYGHYGTAWQNQTREFSAFPGAILMTTNCIQRPADTYMGNIFTTGMVGWPMVSHVSDKDFKMVIDRALEMPGFQDDLEAGHVTVGFGHDALMGVAPKLIDLINAGKIRHIFLVAGCDGAKPGRNYYTEFVEKVPRDCIVMTLACGKFRFFSKQLGEIEGVPRLIDVGQCNDAYSAIRIAQALGEALGVGVNDLPLSLILSWYEQKAVAVLLTLLYLGLKNIRLGPSLPAFMTPNVLNVLVEKYDIKPIGTPEEDLISILGQAK